MLRELKRIVQELNQIPSLDEALDWLARRLRQTLKADACSVFLADYEHQHFVLKATEGLAKDAVGCVYVGFSEGLVGLIGQREEPLNIVDAQQHPSFKHYPEVREDKYHAFLGAPIIHQRKVLGVIILQQHKKHRFSDDDEAILVTLAMQIALEIVHAQTRGSFILSDDLSPNPWQKGFVGMAGSPGLAMGMAVNPQQSRTLKDLSLRRTKQSSVQVSRYRGAVKTTRADMQRLSSSLAHQVADDVLEIFQLYHHLLDANSLGKEVEEKIRQGWTAASALKLVVESYINQFRAMSDPYMRERAVDVEDMGNRLLANLLEETDNPAPEAENIILVADEVSAAMLADVPQHKLKGILSIRGSNNSHAAILARALGIPAVMGLSGVTAGLLQGREIMLDGYSGEVVVDPKDDLRHSFVQLLQEELELQKLVQQEALQPARTSDNCNIILQINAGLTHDTDASHAVSCDGVGLYRTEIPFMLKDRFPTEQEQYVLYRALLAAYDGAEVVMRTLDVGGDKALPYFPIAEENPFLGWRGIRVTLDHPEIFLIQIRAMLRANVGLGNLSILLPMVSGMDEVKEARRLYRQAYYEVSQEAHEQGQTLSMPRLGIMLEVPSLLYMLDELSAEVDFFSVGTNDLTQYLLAVDRNNARVASLFDSYHPAVLRALAHIAQQCERLKMPVSVCGEMAGEPGGALLLMAMGYRRFSMNGHNLQKIRWVIRNVSLQDARALLSHVLAMTMPSRIRSEINMALELNGLGGLVRAGK